VNAKYIYLDMGGYNDGAFGADAGVSTDFRLPHNIFMRDVILNVGLMARDIVPTKVTLKSQQDIYPTQYRLGLALLIPKISISKYSGNDSINVFTDAIAQNSSAKLCLGLEYSFLSRYILRVGEIDSRVTCGIGLKYDKFGIDFALQDTALGGFYRLGLSHRV
jgi:hypothetical protein